MNKIHYNLDGFAACNYRARGEMTALPMKVTCSKCKNTKAYKEMMDGERI